MRVRESALRHVRVIGLFSHRMPELPDVTVYTEHLDRLVRGEILRKVRLASPFVVRSVQPPIQNVEGRRLLAVTRLGKRLVFSFEENLFLVRRDSPTRRSPVSTTRRKGRFSTGQSGCAWTPARSSPRR
jgi:hypothetical protein